eukprot:3260585-Rhodomonas_salina.3
MPRYDISLRARYALSGSDLTVPHGVRYKTVTSALMTRIMLPRPGENSTAQTFAFSFQVQNAPTPQQVRISLRACYAMFGTILAYDATCLRVCYAISGNDLVYATTTRPSVSPSLSAERTGRCAICLRACYAISGTDKAYGPVASYALPVALRCPVLTL